MLEVLGQPWYTYTGPICIRYTWSNHCLYSWLQSTSTVFRNTFLFILPALWLKLINPSAPLTCRLEQNSLSCVPVDQVVMYTHTCQNQGMTAAYVWFCRMTKVPQSCKLIHIPRACTGQAHRPAPHDVLKRNLWGSRTAYSKQDVISR